MRVERHEHAERRSARKGFTFDDPAMVTDQLRYKCKSQARAGDLGRDEGVEQIGCDFRRNAGAGSGEREAGVGHRQRGLLEFDPGACRSS